MKIFNSKFNTYTFWLLKALDYALEKKLDLINLSFGGINFDDEIIKEKLYQLAERNILIIVSAGNDGPSYGSVNFPGNLPYVISVGSTKDNIFSILNTSSRGPGIFNKYITLNKPNIWVPGENIIGLNSEGKLTTKKGSSVSTIIATGFLSLILSHKEFQENKEFLKKEILNVFSLIFHIRDSNIAIPEINFGEITSGIFNPDGLFNLLIFKLEEFSRKKIAKNQENEIKILNDVLDYSLIYNYNYTMSSFNKKRNKKFFYSTKQPEISSVIFYRTQEINEQKNLTSSEILINKEIKISRSERKSDIFLCLKVINNY